jgi:ankyrin repeat protein
MAVSKPVILKQLLEGGADITKSKGIIEYATYYNNLESVKILIEAGEDINHKHNGVYTPLTTAIRDNRTEILSYLLSHGADPNAPGEGLPLINASRYADLSV